MLNDYYIVWNELITVFLLHSIRFFMKGIGLNNFLTLHTLYHILRAEVFNRIAFILWFVTYPRLLRVIQMEPKASVCLKLINIYD